MKLDKISLENFKSLKDNEIELSNITLLTGINSTGKSTVIQGLLLIKQNLLKINEFSQLSLIHPFELLKSINLNGKYIDLGVARDILYENAETDEIKIGFKINDNDFTFKIDTTNESDNDTLPCIIDYNKDKRLLNTENFQYLRAERVGARMYYEYSKSSIERGDIGISGEYTAHYLAQYKNQKIGIANLKAHNSTTDQLLENAANWLSKISKGIDIKSEVINDLKKVKLLYTYDGGKKDYSPQDVGFGITYTLPIIVAILKSKPNDMIVIENPESHLHPSGQVEIAKLCALAANAGVQLIIETHSDHFLNGLRVAVKEKDIDNKNIKVYYFEKDLKESKSIITEIKVNSNGKIENWPKGFFDEFDIQLEKLLW